MTEVDVKKNQKDEKTTAARRNDELSRWNDDAFARWRPSDFFSDPFSVMRRFREEMDRVFSRTMGDEFGDGRVWSPAIEVREEDGKLRVHAELAGLKPEDVKVEALEHALVIQGERKYEHEEKQEGVVRSERRYGRFYREIPLPEGASADEAKAQFKDGVLEIELPVPERKSRRREIPIGNGPIQPAGQSK